MSVDSAVRPQRLEDILSRVEELTDRFRDRVPVAESQRSVPSESIEELREAGLARMLVPLERGGLGLGIRDAVTTTLAVSRADASTGWVSWLMMHVPQVVAMFPAEAQDAVWAGGPDVVTAGSHFGMSVAEEPGGYRISGRAPFTSGVNNADWIYVGGMEKAEAGPPKLRYFLLERGQYTVEDIWDTIGMRGTGSNTVVVEDRFVPAGLTMEHVDAREGTSPGVALSSFPLLRLPWVRKGSLGFVATIVGAAQAALTNVTASLAKKVAPSGAKAAESEALQVEVGRVSAQLDAAEALLLALADQADAGGELDAAGRAAIGRNSAFIVSLSLQAVDTLVELGGTSGFGGTALLQQVWRDVHFAAAHMSLSRKESFARYGRMLLGVEERSPGMFG